MSDHCALWILNSPWAPKHPTAPISAAYAKTPKHRSLTPPQPSTPSQHASHNSNEVSTESRRVS